ncbi:hypothetical protein HFO97_28995 [Rhizobium leguminosarum]|uniref:hypothetical protein n=1 Tax=Rhizobium leguminosarum TaxID=384 RepID=UPI001C9577EE|nr:hypothetical protein [Rhizobium leguminosarum]MBY5363905.1 hypothetical protein [Rhizobium leguminosarum]
MAAVGRQGKDPRRKVRDWQKASIGASEDLLPTDFQQAQPLQSLAVFFAVRRRRSVWPLEKHGRNINYDRTLER